MSKRTFFKEEQQLLKQNVYVLEVSDKSITYTDEFKIHFIAEYEKGLSSRIIFEEADFDVELIGVHNT